MYLHYLANHVVPIWVERFVVHTICQRCVPKVLLWWPRKTASKKIYKICNKCSTFYNPKFKVRTYGSGRRFASQIASMSITLVKIDIGHLAPITAAVAARVVLKFELHAPLFTAIKLKYECGLVPKFSHLKYGPRLILISYRAQWLASSSYLRLGRQSAIPKLKRENHATIKPLKSKREINYPNKYPWRLAYQTLIHNKKF